MENGPSVKWKEDEFFRIKDKLNGKFTRRIILIGFGGAFRRNN